jgi:hypothetical protein
LHIPDTAPQASNCPEKVANPFKVDFLKVTDSSQYAPLFTKKYDGSSVVREAGANISGTYGDQQRRLNLLKDKEFWESVDKAGLKDKSPEPSWFDGGNSKNVPVAKKIIDCLTKEQAVNEVNLFLGLLVLENKKPVVKYELDETWKKVAYIFMNYVEDKSIESLSVPKEIRETIAKTLLPPPGGMKAGSPKTAGLGKGWLRDYKNTFLDVASEVCKPKIKTLVDQWVKTQEFTKIATSEAFLKRYPKAVASVALSGVTDVEPFKKEVYKALKPFLDVNEFRPLVEKLKLPSKDWLNANAKNQKCDLVLEYDGKLLTCTAKAPNNTKSVMGLVDIESNRKKVTNDLLKWFENQKLN